MTPEPGQLVAQKYRLVRPLAEGGMGVVWVARHVELEVDVALKFISEQDAEGAEQARARFKREAQAAAQLKSVHVGQIHDYGVEGSMPYIVMELLEGEDLETLIEREGRLGLDRSVSIVDQLCRGLQVAHDAGVVHRDLKPSNVFLARMGDQDVVKILDFGIAKLMGVRLPQGDRTKSGTIIGSPRYMSPEQTLGKPIGMPTDLWSVGVLIYEMVSGVCPFEHENVFEMAGAICAGPAPVLSDVVSDLPAAMDAFFERALAREPTRRFGSARGMAEAFAAVAAGQPLPDLAQPTTRRHPISDAPNTASTMPSADAAYAATAVASSGQVTTAATVKVISAEDGPGRIRRRRWGLGIAAVALVLLGLLVGSMVLRPSGSSSAGGATSDSSALVASGGRAVEVLTTVEAGAGASGPAETEEPGEPAADGGEASPDPQAAAAEISGRPAGARRPTGASSPKTAAPPRTSRPPTPPPLQTAKSKDEMFGI